MLNMMLYLKRMSWLLTLFVASIAAAQVSVSIPAVVVDKSGQPVHGLQKSEFEVRAGKNVSFCSVEEVPPLNFTGFSEPVPVFILWDAVDMPVLNQNTFLNRTTVSQRLMDYLRKAADDHLAVTVMVYTASGILVIHDMSTDSRVFAAAMDRIMPKIGQTAVPSGSGSSDDFSKAVDQEVSQIQQLTKPMGILRPSGPESLPSQQLESLRVVGKLLQHSRKRKPLVWITDSFPFYVKDGDLNWTLGYGLDQHSNSLGTLNSSYQAAIDSLNDARVSLYPFYVSGHSEDGLKEIAARTGGSLLHYYTDSTDFPDVMADLRKHFDSYYMLTLKTQPTRKTTWIDSAVKGNKPDTKVTAANGFFSIPQ